MGDLLVRNISEGMKHDLSLAAERAGMSLSEKAKELLRQGLQREGKDQPPKARSAWEALRRIALSTDLDGDFSEIMDEIESDRKKDLGRPVESPE